MAAVAALDVGDPIYIGHDDVRRPYRRHALRDPRHQRRQHHLGADGELYSMHLNGVSLTHFAIALRQGPDYVDRITNIVRVTKRQ